MSALDFTARALALRASQEVRGGGSAILNGATADGVTDDRAALNAFIAEGGHVHFPAADYKISDSITVPSDTRLDFAAGARLLPGVANATMILVQGSAPAAWVALSSNLAAGSKTWTHTSNAYLVGDWVEFRSNLLVTSGPNATASKIACLRKIVKKTGSGPYTYTLNEQVRDSFNTADSATVGVPAMVENVVLENVTLNEENYSTRIGFGIYLEYCAHVRIINPTIIGSKDKAGADVVSPDGIKVNHGCCDITIHNPTLKHIGWYGISIVGAAEHVRVCGGLAEDTRHAVSCVYGAYGEPTDILVHGMASANSTLSGFDTHDTGRDIVFSDCLSTGAGDDGFQFRTRNVRAIGCTSIRSTLDGFSDFTGASGHVLVGCVADGDGRMGFNFAGRAELTNCEGRNHTGPLSGYSAIQLQAGGAVQGGKFTGNAGSVFRIYDAPLLVEGIYAPYDAVQTFFAVAITSLGGRYNQVQFRNCEIPGYAFNTLFARQQSARAAGDLPPITSGNRLTTGGAGAEMRGEATLVAGTVTVTTTAVKRSTGVNWTEDMISRVDLRRVTPGGTVGNLYVESVTNGTSFVIRSSNAADTSKVQWAVEL